MNTQEQTDYDDKVKAARAMLAALHLLTRAYGGKAEWLKGTTGIQVRAAIAQAESAGITSKE